MTLVTGITILLGTDSYPGSGADDHLYLGVVGTVGGREFNLDVAEHDDHRGGTSAVYRLGDSPLDPSHLTPRTAPKDLSSYPMHLENVTGVYFRKLAAERRSDDDAWGM